MHIIIELTEDDLKDLVYHELARRLGETPIDRNFVHIKVKSKQNYRSEWEEAAFKATYTATT